MQRIILIIVFIIATVIAYCQTISRLDNSKITAPQLDRKIAQLMKDASVTGLAISVFNDNKAVFSVLVMKLVEEKIIALDTPLQNYLPKPVYEYGKGTSWNQDYTSLKEEPLYGRITARNCLSHSSGLANWRWDEPDQKLHIHFEPGTQYRYSGEGLCYLQF